MASPVIPRFTNARALFALFLEPLSSEKDELTAARILDGLGEE